MYMQKTHLIRLYTSDRASDFPDQPMHTGSLVMLSNIKLTLINELRNEISNNVVCATSKVSDQPAHMRSVIGAFACRLNIL